MIFLALFVFIISVSILIVLVKNIREKEDYSLKNTNQNINIQNHQSNNRNYFKPVTFIHEYVVIDCETTGLNKEDKIIEFTGIKYKEGIEVSRLHYLFNPGRHIEETASKVNGIYDQDVVNKPFFLDYVNEIYSFLVDQNIVGHNLNFDLDFLAREIGEVIPGNYYNTQYIAENIVELNNYKLKTIANYFGIINPKEHSASGDAETTNEVFKALAALADKHSYQIKPYNYQYCLRSWNLSDYIPQTEPNPNSYFYNKRIYFEGYLPNICKKTAFQSVVNRGGKLIKAFRENVDIIVIGKAPRQEILEKIEDLKKTNPEIKILEESDFLRKLNERRLNM